MFYFTMNARTQALDTMKHGFWLTLICGGMLALIYTKIGFHFISIIFFILFCPFAFAGIVFLFGGVLRFITGGKWEITIDSEKINWRAPLIAEHSFEILLKDLSHIEKRIKLKKSGKAKKKSRYRLITIDGMKYRVATQSGLDVNEFLETINKLGFEIHETSVT